MRLATVRVGEAHHVAVVTEAGVHDVVAAAASSKLPAACWTNPTVLLEHGPEALAEVAVLAKKVAPVPLVSVTLGAPIPFPRKLLLLAGNYADHIIEGGKRLEEADKATPRVFMKPPSTTVTGPFDPIPIPKVAQFVDWEAELGVVIGKRCKGVKAADAMDVVAGYTVIDDVSERELLIKPRPESREWDKFFDWLNGKWLDGFAPMGPVMVTKDEIADPHALDVTLTVNGKVQQSGNTGQMIFHLGDIIEYISAVVTLEPGDVIATGTPAGVGHGKGIKLNPGDVVRAEVAGIGAIVNVCEAREV